MKCVVCKGPMEPEGIVQVCKTCRAGAAAYAEEQRIDREQAKLFWPAVIFVIVIVVLARFCAEGLK